MDDLISRQVAIDAIQRIGRLATLPDNDAVIRMSAVEYVLYNLPSEQPMQTNTHNALTALDCISRQAAIDALMAWEEDSVWDEECVKHRGEPYWVAPSDVIEQLPPSAQSEPIKINIEDFNKEDWERLKKEWGNTPITVLSAQPEIIYCKDCRKHNISPRSQEDCCPLYHYRGMSFGSEHDLQFCSYGKRKTDGDK